MQDIKVKFEDLELSTFNPRFTFLTSLDAKLIPFIQSGNKNYSEEETALTLLQNEENLKDMLSLIESIVNSGWIDLGEQLIVVKSDSDKYIVAEGNRRLLALKLLFGFIVLPAKEKFMERTNNQDMHLDEELMGKEDTQTNYNKIKKIIENYNQDSDPILIKKELEVKLVSDSNKLWTLLYTKHISGERPGMRQWKRGKYFVDILNFFPHGININDKELAKKVSVTLRRDIKAIFRDFIQAQFIRDMFEVINNDIEKTKEDIRGANVSALETTYSLKHIKNILKKEKNFTNDHFREMFHLNFEKGSGIVTYSSKIDIRKLFVLIITFYKKGVLKTRPINDEHYDEIAKEVIQVFSNSKIDIDNGMDNETLNKNDIFSFTPDQIDNLLITSSNLNTINIEKLKSAKQVMENDKKINNEFVAKSKELATDNENIFGYLNLQLKHNVKGVVKFTHAQAFTLRTIVEQFFVWGIYFAPGYLQILYNDFSDKESRMNQHIKKLSDNKEMILTLTRKAQQELKPIHVQEILQGICANVDNDLTNFFLAFYNRVNDNRKNSHLINGFIHSYHRFMNPKEEVKMIQQIIKIQTNVLHIIENLNAENINILNNKIKEYIITNREE